MSGRNLSWSILRAIVGGTSAIDVPSLHLRDAGEAAEFLRSYGFDTGEARQRAELEALRQEAIVLLEEELMPDPWRLEGEGPPLDGLGMVSVGERVPAAVREERDVAQLLLMASRPAEVGDVRDVDLQRWACAILRVMHTLAHARTYFNEQFGSQIRAQILERFTPHLHGSVASGDLRLGDGADAIPLVDFEIKHTKPVRSVALKLLHKAENVATDIFDRIGMRFVTRERFDALLVVHYLRVHHVVMFANIKPSRSRNSMLDLEWLRERVEALDEAIAAGEFDPSERRARLRELALAAPPPPEPAGAPANVFSAAGYRAVQFTCRQQIRIRDPYGHDLAGLAAEATARLGATDPLAVRLRERAAVHDEIRFFFPYEIQVLDQQSYAESRSGRASYQEYKARQRAAARQRVLGELLAAESPASSTPASESPPPAPPSGEPVAMAALELALGSALGIVSRPEPALDDEEGAEDDNSVVES